jgi:hypothetical protein
MGSGMGALLFALVAMCGVDTTPHMPLDPVPLWDHSAAPFGRFRHSAAFLRPANPTQLCRVGLAGRKGDAHLCRTRDACFFGTGGPSFAAPAIFRGGNAPSRADALWALAAARRGAGPGAAAGLGGAWRLGEGERGGDVTDAELAGAQGRGAGIKRQDVDPGRRILEELGLNDEQLEAVCRNYPSPLPYSLSLRMY